jgi:hypothetical protein
MLKSDAIDKAGGQTRLAEILGITRSAVSQWGLHVTPLQVYRLRELRPEWFADATPDTATGNTHVAAATTTATAPA